MVNGLVNFYIQKKVYMSRLNKVKKVQFNINIDPGVLERVELLDSILNKHRRNDRHGKPMQNISKSVYWEGIIKEHLNSRDVMQLLAFTNVKVRTEGYLE